ncbi:MAG: hypothetical protein ACE5OZ_26485 [Candidatus Heimdallarchaeota archaeon]
MGILITGSVLIFEVLAGYLANQTSISLSYLVLAGWFFAVCIIPLIVWTKIPLQRRESKLAEFNVS